MNRFEPYIPTVEIAYIGPRAQKSDNVAGTGVIWNGFGDVKAVDARAASIMLKHSDVWCLKEDLPDLAEALKDEIDADDQKDAGDQVADQDQAGDQSPVADDDQQDEQEGQAQAIDNMDEIQKAILALDPSNPDHYTTKGKPKVDAVRALLPEGIETNAQEVSLVFSELGGE